MQNCTPKRDKKIIFNANIVQTRPLFGKFALLINKATDYMGIIYVADCIHVCTHDSDFNDASEEVIHEDHRQNKI